MINRLAGEVEAELAGRPALLRDASSRALAYLDGLADRPVAPTAADVAALDRLDFTLPGEAQRRGRSALYRDGGVAMTALFAGPGASTLAGTSCRKGGRIGSYVGARGWCGSRG